MSEPIERESMAYDVVIVGAGPAGLAAAIRLKQVAAERGQEVSVAVIEKASEVGAHILSGAVIDPCGLDALVPGWREDETCPLKQEVTDDQIWYLTKSAGVRIPNLIMPPFMHNHGNFIGSLGNLCKWLGSKAEELGVEIYPGFAAAAVLYDADGRVKGVQTGDMGIGRDGEPTAGFTPGIELHAKYTLFAEGARGSLTKALIQRFDLNRGRDPQKYGIGLKEIWQVDPAKHRPGLVSHTMGWPLDDKTGGGSFIYHYGENLVAIGFVVHLNYANPYLSPFDEFQRYKLHPKVKPLLEGAKRISYGARAITEGGYQAVPKLIFPGGALIGCAAGFVNVPRIKGSHNAIRTGMMAAEQVVTALAEGREGDELTGYETAYNSSPVRRELRQVRNVKPALSRWGTRIGTLFGGFDMWLNLLLPFLSVWTLRHGKSDAASLKPISDPRAKPIAYPKPDGVITFDRLSSVFISNTNHEEDQPVHLQLKDPAVPIAVNLPLYGEPARLYCPAAVYEVLYDDEGQNPRFQINAQNCVHCKTCDIKDPSQNINWTVPQGGEGPVYTGM